METLHEALFYEARADKSGTGMLCPHHCHIHEGGRAVCAVRLNCGGRLYTLVYDKIISREDRRRQHVAGLKG